MFILIAGLSTQKDSCWNEMNYTSQNHIPKTKSQRYNSLNLILSKSLFKHNSLCPYELWKLIHSKKTTHNSSSLSMGICILFLSCLLKGIRKQKNFFFLSDNVYQDTIWYPSPVSIYKVIVLRRKFMDVVFFMGLTIIYSNLKY